MTAHKAVTLWQKEHPFAVAILVIALGVCLRLCGLNFDGGQHLHPDERFLNMVVAGIEWPESPAAYFDTQHSSLNPVNHENLTFFVYGTLPVFLGKAIGDLTGTGNYGSFLLTGRMLSASADIASIVLIFLLARRFFSYNTGLIAASLYACAVFPIQISHFFTVDPFLNLFLLAALYYVLDYSRKPGIKAASLTGFFWGLALASKISGLSFITVILLAGVLSLKFQGPLRVIALGILTLIIATLIYRLFNPYTFSTASWFNWQLDSRFLSNLATLRSIAEPFSGFPPSLQWAFRTPWLFSLENMAVWGLGLPFFAVAVLGGFLLAVKSLLDNNPTAWLLLMWALTTIGLVGAQSGQTMRYLIPVYPLAAIFGAYCLLELRKRLEQSTFSCWPIVFVVGFSLCWAMAFSSIYRQPNTRIEASTWIYKNIPIGSSLAVEKWDDGLPLHLPGTNPNEYRFVHLELTDKDTTVKQNNLISHLEESDYLILSSNRLYGSITRLKGVFPLTYRYYELLFGNLSGFSLVAEFVSYPMLGYVSVPDDSAEEAFTVYDHPRVFIFKKNESFSSDFLKKEFQAVDFPDTTIPPQLIQKVPSAPVTPVTSLGLKNSRQAEPIYLWRWIVVFWLAGLAGTLVSRHFLPGTGFPGRSLVAVSGTLLYALGLKYSLWSSQVGVLLVLVVLVLAAVLSIWEQGGVGYEKEDSSYHYVFWGTFFFFLFLRAYNPAIFWGERPFDFSLLNTMMRTEALPPIDPWMSPHPLNYHAWGQLVIAFWGRLAHVPPEYTYNLGAALVPALVCEMIFWTAKYLTKRVVPAVISVVVMIFTGNLSSWFLQPWRNGFTFGDFWDASRIVPATINEFPFWTALFADLHGHFIGMIFSTLFLASCALVLTNRSLQWQGSALQGLALGLLTLTNPWALPVYLIVGVLLTANKQRAGEFLPSLFALCIAFLVALPFWSGQQNLISISWAEQQITVTQLILLFGPFLAAYLLLIRKKLETTLFHTCLFAGIAGGLIWLSQSGVIAIVMILALGLMYLWKRQSSQRSHFLHVLMITGLLVLVGCEFFTLWDRMNTIFKFHFEVWILFSLASALIVRELLDGKKTFDFNVSAVLLILGLGLLTSVCTLIAWWKNPMAPIERFTLNGFAFLEKNNPDEVLMIHWLGNRRGQPAISEAFGPSYGPYSRVSSFTGLPT
ncbi:MAG: glycosyltransferase family 39 protein, partial [Proteobacteria bacterium]|nr:glycosyltransferase family 39 protein [Pseudomonadota bacterium]